MKKLIKKSLNYLVRYFIAHFWWNEHRRNGTNSNKIEFNRIYISINRRLEIFEQKNNIQSDNNSIPTQLVWMK